MDSDGVEMVQTKRPYRKRYLGDRMEITIPAAGAPIVVWRIAHIKKKKLVVILI